MNESTVDTRPSNLSLVKIPGHSKFKKFNIRKASQYTYSTDKVYTFHNIDEVVDIANFRVRLPFASVDIAKVIGNQPISFRAVTNVEVSWKNIEAFFIN